MFNLSYYVKNRYKTFKSKNIICYLQNDCNISFYDILEKIKLFDISNSSIKILKKSSKINVISIDNLILKKYNYCGIFYTILHMFSLKRSERNLLFSNYLRDANILAPKVIGIIKIKRFGITYSNILIMENLTPKFKFVDKIVRNNNGEINYQEIVYSLTKLLYELHSNNIFHGDLNLRNICCQHNNNFQIICGVIDLDGTKFYKQKFPISLKYRELARLISSYLKITLEKEINCNELTKDFVNCYKQFSGIDLSGKKLDAKISKFLK